MNVTPPNKDQEDAHHWALIFELFKESGNRKDVAECEESSLLLKKGELKTLVEHV